MKKLLYLFLILLLFLPCNTQAKTVHVLLDPGHGGSQDGATSADGSVKEKDVNLKIGLALKQELEENYEGIEVSMTRDSDVDVGLKERVDMGSDCDFIISLHNNAIAEKPAYDNGCTVLVASGRYRKKVALETRKMGANILLELEDLGLENRGLLTREALDGEKYPNGEIMDHYKIVRYGILSKVPAIIVEHAFIDKDSEFEEHLKDDEGIEELAKADARGIARYFGLKTIDGEKMEPVEGEEFTVVSMKDDDWTNTTQTKEVFYQEKDEKPIEPKVEINEEYAAMDDSAAEVATTEQTMEATTEMKIQDPVARADMGGDKIEQSDLGELHEEPPRFPKLILMGIIGTLIILGGIIVIIKKVKR